jgi:hypothetical protein
MEDCSFHRSHTVNLQQHRLLKLRDIVVHVSLQHVRPLMHPPNGNRKGKGAFAEMMAEEGEFAADIMQALLLNVDRNIDDLPGPNDDLTMEMRCADCTGIWRTNKTNSYLYDIQKACPSCRGQGYRGTDLKVFNSVEEVEPDQWLPCNCHRCDQIDFLFGNLQEGDLICPACDGVLTPEMYDDTWEAEPLY